MFIVNIFRWIFALSAKCNPDRIRLYANIRFCTWVVQSLAIIGGLLGYFMAQSMATEVQEVNILLTLGSIAAAILICGIDFHFCRVLKYAAMHPQKNPRASKYRNRDRDAKENFSDSDFDDRIKNPYD